MFTPKDYHSSSFGGSIVEKSYPSSFFGYNHSVPMNVDNELSLENQQQQQYLPLLHNRPCMFEPSTFIPQESYDYNQSFPHMARQISNSSELSMLSKSSTLPASFPGRRRRRSNSPVSCKLPLLFRRHPELLKKQQYSAETWQRVLLSKFGTLSEKLIAAASTAIISKATDPDAPLNGSSAIQSGPGIKEVQLFRACSSSQNMSMQDIKDWLGGMMAEERGEINLDNLKNQVPPMPHQTEEDSSNRSSPSMKRKKKKRSFCDPPRPRNAFIIFRNHYQPILQELYPNVKMQDLSRLLGQMWKETDDQVKQEYRRCAYEERQLHKKKYPTFKYHQQPPALIKKKSS